MEQKKFFSKENEKDNWKNKNTKTKKEIK